MKEALNFTFPEDLGYRVTLDETLLVANKESVGKYYQFDFWNRNHTVIAIQGTDTGAFMDLFVDLRILAATISFVGIKQFYPSLNWVSSRSRSFLQGLMLWVIDIISHARSTSEVAGRRRGSV